jgi:hypothetical protein
MEDPLGFHQHLRTAGSFNTQILEYNVERRRYNVVNIESPPIPCADPYYPFVILIFLLNILTCLMARIFLLLIPISRYQVPAPTVSKLTVRMEVQ